MTESIELTLRDDREIIQKYMDESVKHYGMYLAAMKEISVLKVERDAAVEDLKTMANGIPCDVCGRSEKLPCAHELGFDCWEWRGLTEETECER